MNIFEKLTHFTENIIETVPKEQFMYIFIWGMVWLTFYNFMFTIITAIEKRIWIVEEYEKIIADNLYTYDTDDYKEQCLIANAKRNTERIKKCLEKRKSIKEKIKRLFGKGKKNDR